MAETGFPIASAAQVRAMARKLMGRHRSGLLKVTLLFGLAAAAGLTSPWLLGRMVNAVVEGTTFAELTGLAIMMLIFLLMQTVLVWFANMTAMVLGEKVLAQLREDFIAAVTKLPLSTVESAGTGDLVTRTTTDIDAVSNAVRYAVPQIVVTTATTVATVVAAILVSPLLSLALLVGVPLLVTVTRWYLHRSPSAYREVRQSYSGLNSALTETVEGARTVDALHIGWRRRMVLDAAIHRAYTTRRTTLRLQTILYPATGFAFSLPVLATLLWGGWLAQRDLVTAGAVATMTLYAVQAFRPVEELIRWLDELQTGAVALGRIIGVEHVPPDRKPSSVEPTSDDIALADVTYAYFPGRDVLHGVSLDLRRGERLAMVGPSGSGKSTIGRLIAGVYAPASGAATVGGVPLVDRPLEKLRSEVGLITQEHHVFVGSIADNVRLGKADATRNEIEAALTVVGALDWARGSPDGLDTRVGSGGHRLTPAQEQELALARLILADPHTLVLDEATSLLDPRAARAAERSLGSVLQGRTVVAIAHRLHTALDADRIAVVEDGRITELGSHQDLLHQNGPYAALWRSWRDQG